MEIIYTENCSLQKKENSNKNKDIALERLLIYHRDQIIHFNNRFKVEHNYCLPSKIKNMVSF